MAFSNHFCCSRRVHRDLSGFTLVELLTVISVIGLLSAILIPTLSSARAAADRTKTRIQFSQWSAAIEAFRQEYGYYPSLDPTGKVNGGADTTAADLHLFYDVLSARRRDGSALPPSDANSAATPPSPENQNTRRISFIGFTASDIFSDSSPESDQRNLLHDAFGNCDIAVLVDRNLDGKIDTLDYPILPGVSPPDNAATVLRPSLEDFPAAGVRATVLFYVAPPKATNATGLILSWK